MIDSLIESFLRFWSFFALIHIGCGRERNLVTRNYSRILVSFFLIVYAINTVMIVYLDKPKVNVISASANLMQFLLNLLMVSVVLIVLMRNVKLAKRIISELLQFSSKLNDLDIAINYKKIQRIWYTIIGFSLAIILIYVAVEGCVVFVTKMMTIRYWSLTILPSIFMIMFLIKAICVLWLLFTFYKKINKAMRLEMTKKKDSPVEKQWIVQLSHSQMESPRGYSAAQTKDMVPGLLDIIKNLKEICHLVDIYFGPIFLVTFATIFVVTTTQFYYVYELISHSRKYYMTYWHLVMSFNIVAINLFLAICVTALCQSITNQSKKSYEIMENLQAIDCSSQSEKIYKMMVHGRHGFVVAFTAANFFNMNFKMLCGMTGAITTYLIILIQFAQVNSDLDPVITLRSVQAETNLGRESISRIGSGE